LKRKEVKLKNIDLKQYKEIEVVNYLNITKHKALNLLKEFLLHRLINIVANIK